MWQSMWTCSDSSQNSSADIYSKDGCDIWHTSTKCVVTT